MPTNLRPLTFVTNALLDANQPLTSDFPDRNALLDANQPLTSDFPDPNAIPDANQPTTSDFLDPNALRDANQPSTSDFPDPNALLDANQPSTADFLDPNALRDANQPSTSDFPDPNALLDANQPSTADFLDPNALLDANQSSTSAFTNLAAALDINQLPYQSSTLGISDQLYAENNCENDNVFQPVPRKIRRFPPHEKLITDVDTALQEEHFNPLDLISNEKKSYKVELQKASKDQQGALITCTVSTLHLQCVADRQEAMLIKVLFVYVKSLKIMSHQKQLGSYFSRRIF